VPCLHRVAVAGMQPYRACVGNGRSRAVLFDISRLLWGKKRGEKGKKGEKKRGIAAEPITSRILSTGMLNTSMRGAMLAEVGTVLDQGPFPIFAQMFSHSLAWLARPA